MATESITHADGEITYFCSECDCVLDDNVMCDCQEYARPVPSSKFGFEVTCSECGYSGSVELVQLHSCDIAKNGGRCEDYPCCGHTDGDGCQTLREHTSEYWSGLMQQLGQDRYDELDQMGYWD